jgi:ankyrin repeat protein
MRIKKKPEQVRVPNDFCTIASAGHTAVAEFLIEAGANVNAQNESGQTAL